MLTGTRLGNFPDPALTTQVDVYIYIHFVFAEHFRSVLEHGKPCPRQRKIKRKNGKLFLHTFQNIEHLWGLKTQFSHIREGGGGRHVVV